MLHYSRFLIASFAIVLAGLWSFSAAAQAGLPPEVAGLLTDQNICWRSSVYFFTGEQVRKRIADFTGSSGEIKVDRTDPNKPKIAYTDGRKKSHGADRGQTEWFYYHPVPCDKYLAQKKQEEEEARESFHRTEESWKGRKPATTHNNLKQIGIATHNPTPAPSTTFANPLFAPMLPGPITVGVGATILVPHVEVGWQGTGTFGGVTSTFTNPQILPTLEMDVLLFTIPVGATPLTVGVSGNVMIPTGGTSTRNVESGPFTGTESFQQGWAGSAFVDLETPIVAFDPVSARFIVGVGAAFNQHRETAVFPAAGDFFSTGKHTDVVPAFQAGVTLLINRPDNPGNFVVAPPGAELDLLFSDFLPGPTDTMPGGTPVSFGTAKAGNTLGFTGKLTIPLSGLIPGPPRP